MGVWIPKYHCRYVANHSGYTVFYLPYAHVQNLTITEQYTWFSGLVAADSGHWESW